MRQHGVWQVSSPGRPAYADLPVKGGLPGTAPHGTRVRIVATTHRARSITNENLQIQNFVELEKSMSHRLQ